MTHWSTGQNSVPQNPKHHRNCPFGMLERRRNIKKYCETVSDKKLFHDGKEGEEREMKGGALNPYLMTLLIVFFLVNVLVHAELHFLELNWVESNGPFMAVLIARLGLL